MRISEAEKGLVFECTSQCCYYNLYKRFNKRIHYFLSARTILLSIQALSTGRQHKLSNTFPLIQLLLPNLALLQSRLNMLIHHWTNALQEAGHESIRRHQTCNSNPHILPTLLTRPNHYRRSAIRGKFSTNQ